VRIKWLITSKIRTTRACTTLILPLQTDPAIITGRQALSCRILTTVTSYLCLLMETCNHFTYMQWHPASAANTNNSITARLA